MTPELVAVVAEAVIIVGLIGIPRVRSRRRNNRLREWAKRAR